MKQLTHKRLSAWLLTLVMLMGMLPAMASADEVDEDLSPPAPQEDYGYVRLVFAEGEQLDLHHGEYITERSPTAEVFGNAGEDFLTDGDYLALYYEGRLYHKAALDGVRIDADAVLPAEDFALVPMGELAAQAPPSGAEPAALTTEETTTEPTEETTTEPTEETTTEPTGETTTETTVETTTEPTGEEQPAPEVRKAPQRAAGDKYGYASFQFRQSGVKAIYLHSGEYINDCKGDTVPTTWQATAAYPDIYDFIRDGDYKALHYQGFLYLKGDLDLHGANLNVDMMKLGFGISPKIHVREDASLYNSDSLIYSYDTGVEIYLPTGKTLALNAVRPGPGNQLYPGAIRAAGEVTITGGGTLNILYTLTSTESGTTPRTLFGLYGGEGVTLRGSENHGTGPTVNIKMDSGAFGPEANDVVGIYSGRGDLIIKGDSKVKIEMLGHKLGQKTTEEDVNWAIKAKRLELLDNASLEILSHKNVIHDIVLTAESGDVLTVDTTGFLNIRNKGDIQRYDEGTWQHLKHDYPKNNIHIESSAKGAKAKIFRAEQGVKIESFSSYIDNWYNKLNDPEQGDWNWAISGGADPELGTNMYRGNRRIDHLVQADSTTSIYTWGSMEYIYEPQGVVTVQKSNGLVMDWHAPEGNPQGSSLYYAKVLEPNFNDIHILRKGESLTLVAPDGKGTFLYWYDAQNPEGSANGTSWKNLTQKFTNIQRDMTLVPVRDPMTAGPTLSDVGYSVQWDKGVTKQTRYAYQDMTFAKANDIISTGGYRVMLVPAQLPAYGEKTYAVKDLNGSPLMGLCSARLYADKNAKFSTDELGNWFFNIPPGRYRIACMDDDSNHCFISKPFTFDPPVAPPYIDPVTQIFDTNDGGTKTVKITAERNQPIKYRQWDYTKNKWGSLQEYKGPFEVTVTPEQDERIEAYAGPITLDRRSEVRYAVRPTDVPTVKYGDTVVSDGIGRYFYGSIDLTVEAPEGYEVWYRVDEQPSESNMGNKVENGGKVTITDSGSHGIIFFKLAKAFTVDGVTYRKLSHQETSVHLTKLETLPAPKVTVTTKDGGQTLIPSGNTYTMTENVVTVTLEPNGNWPLDATIAYDTNGNATPRLSQSYTTPFEVRGAGTISVFTLVPKADGGYDYERTAYTFKLAESLQTVPVSAYNGNCTASYRKEDGSWEGIFSYSKELKVGTRVKVTPNPPDGQVFKKWEIGNYDEYNIWGTYGTDELYKPVLFFYVPKPNYSSYGSQPKTLTVKATFATAAEASISGQTKVDLVMKKTVGESISLNYTTKEMRSISYQWWEGDSVGTADNALPGAVKFDPNKTYTVKVTITANPGVSFTNSAGVAIGHYGGHFTVPNGKIDRTNNTLTFTATPIRQIDLTMPAPLTVGDSLPTIDDVGGLPAGVTVQKLEWPYTTGTTVPDDDSVRAALTLKTDGTHPILVDEYKYPTVNGVEHMYTRNSSNDYVTDGSTVMVGNIDLPVKSKGVAVSGKITSYNPNNPTTVELMQNGTVKYTVTIDPTTGSGQKEQNFSFNVVAPGTYDLVVTKPGHLSYTVKGVVVGDGPLDLTKHSNAAISTITLLCGDIDGNGFINSTDLGIILKGQNYGKSTATAGDKAADLDGNGFINSTDLGIVLQGQHYGKSAVSVNFGG